MDWLLIGIPGLIWGASFLFIAEGLGVLWMAFPLSMFPFAEQTRPIQAMRRVTRARATWHSPGPAPELPGASRRPGPPTASGTPP